MDDWINSRNADLPGIYEWRGYCFFYVRFAPRAEEGLVGASSLNPLPPPCSTTPGLRGYGEDHPLRSRALERGRAAQQDDQRCRPAAVEASQSAPGLTSGESPGYQARLQGYESRGEANTNAGAWARSLADEGLVPEDLSQMPLWLGIETQTAERREKPYDSESSHSSGSFEVVSEPNDVKDIRGSEKS